MAILVWLKAAAKTAKFWVAIGAVIALVVAAKLGYSHVWDAGYQARVEEEKADYTVALNAAVANARVEWNKSAAAARESSNAEEKIIERIRVVERRVPQIVERTVAGECRDLGPDIHRLLVEATRAANGYQDPGPAAPAEPSSGVPGVPGTGNRAGG